MNHLAWLYFLNRHFEWPLALILILLLVAMMLAGRRRKETVPSRIIFELGENSAGDGVWTLWFFLLPAFLILLYLTLQIIALAGPRSVEVQIVEKKTKGRVAVLIDDVSGSMDIKGADETSRIQKMVKVNKAFLNEFCGEDGKIGANYVGLVVFEDTASVMMSPTRDCNVIHRRLELLSARGGTAIEKGLWQGITLLIGAVDKRGLISDSELRSVYSSLHERVVRLPKRSKEFCDEYKGLSIELFTDGDFPGDYDTREKALQFTQGMTMGVLTLNPFHVIDVAKSLCIRTYFWSVNNLSDSYKEAFAAPPGGFAVLISDLNPKLLTESYRNVARIEAGDLIRKEVETYNPLKTYFLLAAFGFSVVAMVISWSKTFSYHSERG